jgi:hypothetical protein
MEHKHQASDWDRRMNRKVLEIHKKLDAGRTYKQRKFLSKERRVKDVLAHAQDNKMADVVKYLHEARRLDGSLTYADVL